jgi:type II secretory pathway pseudopilin PulG
MGNSLPRACSQRSWPTASPTGARGQRGFTYVEIAFMMLIVTILVISLAQAIQFVSVGTLAAKERTRALSMAQDKIEEIKSQGFTSLTNKYSNYLYPDDPDPVYPLFQNRTKPPYPAVKPSAAEDPWTPEILLEGNTYYWRHVKVKFVQESTVGGTLMQSPQPDIANSVVGGTNTGSNLAFVEVDVTWYSRRSKRMEQVWATTLVSSESIPVGSNGEISGTVLDDDANNDGVDGGLDGSNVTLLGSDDRPISLAEIVIFARNASNGESYGTKTSITNGTYTLQNLPDGSYTVELVGPPKYKNSAYTGYTSGTYSTTVMTVSLTPSNRTRKNINIWTKKIRTIEVRGAFTGINDPLTPHGVLITCSDGFSQPVLVSATLSAGESWGFTLPTVAFPELGQLAAYKITLNDMTGGKAGYANICLDGNKAINPFIFGSNCLTPAVPHYGSGSSGCGGCAKCIDPDTSNCESAAYLPIDLGVGYSNGWVRVMVKEYYNQKSDYPLSSMTTGRIKMVNKVTGATVIMELKRWDVPYVPYPYSIPPPPDWGATIFSVPVANAQQIEFTAYMTTTGFTSDTYFLPFPIMPDQGYELEENCGASSTSMQPLEPQRHTFVIKRVSAICGTVWAVAGTKGYPGAQVSVYNESTLWQTVVVADGSGRFYAPEVPVESGEVYRVAPITGSDLISDPLSRHVMVITNGLTIRSDNLSMPMEFTLNAINGVIRGTVKLNGKLISTGATVIASTLDTGSNTFVASFPSALLNGKYSYSTVTMTDGTYKLKVATGVGSYFVYVVVTVDGVQYTKKLAAIAVAPNTEYTQDIALP